MQTLLVNLGTGLQMIGLSSRLHAHAFLILSLQFLFTLPPSQSFWSVLLHFVAQKDRYQWDRYHRYIWGCLWSIWSFFDLPGCLFSNYLYTCTQKLLQQEKSILLYSVAKRFSSKVNSSRTFFTSSWLIIWATCNCNKKNKKKINKTNMLLQLEFKTQDN